MYSVDGSTCKIFHGPKLTKILVIRNEYYDYQWTGFIRFVIVQHWNANCKWNFFTISVPNWHDYENGVTY